MRTNIWTALHTCVIFKYWAHRNSGENVYSLHFLWMPKPWTFELQSLSFTFWFAETFQRFANYGNTFTVMIFGREWTMLGFRVMLCLFYHSFSFTFAEASKQFASYAKTLTLMFWSLSGNECNKVHLSKFSGVFGLKVISPICWTLGKDLR